MSGSIMAIGRGERNKNNRGRSLIRPETATTNGQAVRRTPSANGPRPEGITHERPVRWRRPNRAGQTPRAYSTSTRYGKNQKLRSGTTPRRQSKDRLAAREKHRRVQGWLNRQQRACAARRTRRAQKGRLRAPGIMTRRRRVLVRARHRTPIAA